jgi:hypothetical protein
MPDSLEGLSAGAQIQLQNADPELFQLLGNTAPAELELAAMNQQLGDAAPTAQQRQDAATAARIAELVESNPFGTQGYYAEDGSYIPAVQGSVTAQFELQALAPELAAKLQAEATPATTPINPADAAIWQQHGYATAS